MQTGYHVASLKPLRTDVPGEGDKSAQAQGVSRGESQALADCLGHDYRDGGFAAIDYDKRGICYEKRAQGIALRHDHEPQPPQKVRADDDARGAGDIAEYLSHASLFERDADTARNSGADGIAHKESACRAKEFSQAACHARENGKADSAHEHVDAACRSGLLRRQKECYENDDGGLKRKRNRPKRYGEKARNDEKRD